MVWIEALLETELGPMLAIADDKGVHLLEFTDRDRIARKKERSSAAIVPGSNLIIVRLQEELISYFAGTLQKFQTPVHLTGTSFQKAVWRALQQIPYGEKRSYKEQAESLGRSTAYRAVANANGANQVAILLPCHRIVRSDGETGGYGGGRKRKKWLLNHERTHR